MSRVGGEIPIAALIAFLGEVLSTSSARVLTRQQEIDERMIEIKREMDELKDLADAQSLKDKNLKQKEQSLKNQYGDTFEQQESELLQLYSELGAVLETGNDLLWISEKLKDLFLEYQQLKFVELPKLKVYEVIHKRNFDIIDRLKTKFEEIRDKLDEALTKLDEIEEQAAQIPPVWGPVIAFVIKKIIELIVNKIFNPIVNGVKNLISVQAIDNAILRK
jgi:hypothetical protein